MKTYKEFITEGLATKDGKDGKKVAQDLMKKLKAKGIQAKVTVDKHDDVTIDAEDDVEARDALKQDSFTFYVGKVEVTIV